MKVYKFGGASVKDISGIKNLVHILKEEKFRKELVVVVSAMGKMTNALEKVVEAYFKEDDSINKTLDNVCDYHLDIVNELFEDSQEIKEDVNRLIDEIPAFLSRNKSPNYNFVYDQVVSYGELLSTTIISAYLKEQEVPHNWLDIRECFKTDAFYREGNIDWEKTQKLLLQTLQLEAITLTQGFIGSDPNGFTTTLGREGSDYTAAILAYCLNARAVTIWKDVPGVLNADPRYFNNTTLLNLISYQEAIELAFYGASVIHPKTLQPLQRKEIPLYVRPFTSPNDQGTCVGPGLGITPDVPCFIVKKNQVLLSLSSLDFSFMMEENIGEVFKLLGKFKMKVDLIQNSAISFSVCVEDKYHNIEALINALKAHFKVDINLGVDLYTIRHFTEKAVNDLKVNKKILVKQVSGKTVQLVVANP